MKTKKIIAHLWLVGLLLTAGMPAIACEACKKQQPKALQGITHGPGPDSNWDYVAVIIMVVITVYSLYAMIKCLAKPADKMHQQIKNSVLE